MLLEQCGLIMVETAFFDGNIVGRWPEPWDTLWEKNGNDINTVETEWAMMIRGKL